MPTYDYRCEKCGIVFEHFQSMKEEPLQSCIHPEGCRHPKAKGKVSRLLGTGAGIIFKGSGFYATDYRSQDYKEAAKRDNGKPSESKDSSSTKDSGSKADKKTETKKSD